MKPFEEAIRRGSPSMPSFTQLQPAATQQGAQAVGEVSFRILS